MSPRRSFLAEIRPFGALRYAAVDELGPVLAPPFDVISPEEQEALHRLDPHNVIRLELARGGTEEPLAGRYAHAAETLHQWRRRNVLGHDTRPAYYPYEERFTIGRKEYRRRGFFVTVRLHPWSDRIVLPHERTRPKPKADRRELLHTCRTQFSPIFSLYEDPDGEVSAVLDEVMRETPIACGRVESPAAREIARDHTLWRAANRPAQRLTDLFVHRQLFIADGHHRYETALDYRDERRHATDRWDAAAPYEYAMMLLVPIEDTGLLVLPTHRLLDLAAPADPSRLLAGWESDFVVEARPLPPRDVGTFVTAELARRGTSGHVFAAVGLLPETVHLLTLKRAPRDWPHPESWRDLDVGLLEALIVEPLKRSYPAAALEFTHDPDEALRYGTAGRGRLSLLLNPTGVEQILAVARAGDRMPEKSTYFTPKVATGLVMYPLE